MESRREGGRGFPRDARSAGQRGSREAAVEAPRGASLYDSVGPRVRRNSPSGSKNSLAASDTSWEVTPSSFFRT